MSCIMYQNMYNLLSLKKGGVYLQVFAWEVYLVRFSSSWQGEDSLENLSLLETSKYFVVARYVNNGM